ncbi:MFS transporter [Streptomyces sp. CMB-StM0423]|uniref:MFS transporter n=1 Tax=Streptomyces sp. CMB-StM0423 TaxID=2059884 RepID=UPI001F3430EA|nr:MFS transporter [Streptomyces sp. CMB-StM0423]
MSDTTAPDGAAAPVPAAPPSGQDGTGAPAGVPADAPAGAADPRARYADVFRVREFRFVFAAHVMSILGEVVAAIALTVLVYDRTGSPLLSALTLGVGLLPYLVGGTLLSSIADRLPARRVLVTCDLLAAACFLTMVLPGMPVAALLALRCVAGVISPVFTGTRIATLADILGTGDRFVLGRSVIRLTAQAAQLVGFALGGLLAAFSPRATLTLTAVGLLCSALVLRFGTRARPPRTAAGGAAGAPGRTSTVGDSLAAAGTFLRDRRIRALLLLTWIPPTFVVAPEALAAAYADDLGIGALGLGLLMTGMPIGAVTSEILAGSLLGPRGRERIVFPVAVFATVPAIGFVTHPSFGWALPLLVLTGFGISYSLGLDQWFVAAVPEEMRGRAMTLQTAGLMTLQGVGMACAGAVAEFAPVHLAVAAVGVTGTVCSLLVCLEVRRTRPKGETGLTAT